MTGKLHLRPARSDEVECLQALERDAAEAFRVLPGYAFAADLPARDAAEHARVRDRGAALVVDDRRGNLAGFVLLLPIDGRAHVFEAAVARSYQGQGIGRELIASAEDWMLGQGFHEATLTTYRDVPWNRPFYECLGYRVFEPGPDRAELRPLIAEEIKSGFARMPRVAMRKPLTARTSPVYEPCASGSGRAWVPHAASTRRQ